MSNPNTDFLSSRVTGFTQSETSTAWCGSNVVVGFNDSGSVIETFGSLLAGINGLSVNGVALSTDEGHTFQDLGSLNPGPDPSGFLAGDPVIGCADNKTFYYSSLFESGFFPDLLTSVSVSKSTDGGATFGNPVAAASKSAFTHLLDKDWMAIDPTNPNRVFVTYTDFDGSGAVCGLDGNGFPIFRNAIELNWLAPAMAARLGHHPLCCRSSATSRAPYSSRRSSWARAVRFMWHGKCFRSCRRAICSRLRPLPARPWRPRILPAPSGSVGRRRAFSRLVIPLPGLCRVDFVRAPTSAWPWTAPARP